ncbi:hypothetical protein [Deinococcus roseus]|uniref:Uncharacterized protein n=1 Tax=Deinococcus roseus TaxID=392414 RepID=A0ABQ2D2P3_9DEIO|nr:hypothetical protein [Deinococcus roseus]GGJ43536.1 hypothetical protein GCM10008938_32270 [Deinococcus roseus]
MSGSDTERHAMLSAQNLPKTSKFEEALYSLGDEWEMIEHVHLGHFTNLYVFLSVYGVHVVFPQTVYGVVDHYRYRLVINNENISKLAESILKSTVNLKRMLNCPVIPIMLHRQLIDAEEARDGFYDSKHPRQWDFIGVKLLTWESFGPHLKATKQPVLTQEELKVVRQKLKNLF